MEIVSKFLGIVHIEGTPNAETIFEAIDEYATTVTLPTEKMLCITDGASLMCGSRNSVTRKALDKWNPTAFKQHCVVHKEVLGVKAALKDIPDFVEETVSKVLGFFKYSAKRVDKFHQLVKLTDPTKKIYKLI